VIWLQVAVLLGAILIGARLQGISLGMMGGLGLAILVFVFHLKPAEPPVTVVLIITAVVTAASALETAGGLGYLSNLAEKAIKKYPHRITFIAPLISYLFTFLAGTGHVIYSILPIIANVARESGVRPERPLSASVIATQQAAIASPISAPTAILVSILAPQGIELLTILSILIPATLGGMIITTLIVNKMGKELSEEPSYIAYLQQNKQEIEAGQKTPAQLQASPAAKRSVILFLAGIGLIVVLGAFKGLRPSWEVNGKLTAMDMPVIIEVLMLSVAAIITLTCKIKATEITKASVFTSGIQAVVSILGISWLGDTFVNGNRAEIMELVQNQIINHPWQFGFILFFMSILLVSQTATMRALMPLGLALGIPATTLLAVTPAVNGVFFIPNYPTLLAAINLDRTGTTRVGKYMLNHSFMLPGLIATISASLIAFGLVYYFL
jgi:anaerobic C4-dicarboxylate transporter DcuA